MNESRRSALAEYEGFLDALESALSEPLAIAPAVMKEQSERWTALLNAVRKSAERLASAVRTTGVRLFDAEKSGLLPRLNGDLRERAAAASQRTATLEALLRSRMIEASDEISKRRSRRPSNRIYSRVNRGGQIDLRA